MYIFLSLAIHRSIKLADLRKISCVKNASMLYPSTIRISVLRSVVYCVRNVVAHGDAREGK